MFLDYTPMNINNLVKMVGIGTHFDLRYLLDTFI